MPTTPVGVSYVMPVLNEAGYLEAAVASIVAQDHPGEFEIVLAVGPSTDGTADIVARLVAADDRIRIVDNPDMDIPIGLNLAIAASRHPIIIRVDAPRLNAPARRASAA
jgi:succinoglycan biosynthesis protein ExoA